MPGCCAVSRCARSIAWDSRPRPAVSFGEETFSMPRKVWRLPCAAVLPALALAGVLGGCASDEVVLSMMPAPIIMQDARLDFTRHVAPEDRASNVLPVLFATPRAP